MNWQMALWSGHRKYKSYSGCRPPVQEQKSHTGVWDDQQQARAQLAQRHQGAQCQSSYQNWWGMSVPAWECLHASPCIKPSEKGKNICFCFHSKSWHWRRYAHFRRGAHSGVEFFVIQTIGDHPGTLLFSENLLYLRGQGRLWGWQKKVYWNNRVPPWQWICKANHPKCTVDGWLPVSIWWPNAVTASLFCPWEQGFGCPISPSAKSKLAFCLSLPFIES